MAQSVQTTLRICNEQVVAWLCGQLVVAKALSIVAAGTTKTGMVLIKG